MTLDDSVDEAVEDSVEDSPVPEQADRMPALHNRYSIFFIGLNFIFFMPLVLS